MWGREAVALAAALAFAAEVAAFTVGGAPSLRIPRTPGAPAGPARVPRRNAPQAAAAGLRMSGLGGGLFDVGPKSTGGNDDPFNPVRPDPSTMNPKVIGLMEDMGVMKEGEWLSEDELLVEWEKLYPGWRVAAWPLGSIDIGHVTARDRLVTAELGGDPLSWPMGEPPRVLCVGEALIDAIADDPSVKPGDPADRWTAFAGGAPANVACALAKLGTPVGFIGAVGRDGDGEKLREVLGAAKLPLQMLQSSAKPTRRVQVTRDARGERQFAGFEGGLSSGSFADTDLDVSQVWFGFEGSGFRV